MKNAKLLSLISVILLLYWLVTKFVDIYALHPIAGILYETTALIILLCTYVLPIIIISFLIKSDTLNRKKFILPFIISVVAILVLHYFPFMYKVEAN